MSEAPMHLQEWASIYVRIPRDHYERWNIAIRNVADALGLPNDMSLDVNDVRITRDGLTAAQRIRVYETIANLLDCPVPIIRKWLETGSRKDK